MFLTFCKAGRNTYLDMWFIRRMDPEERALGQFNLCLFVCFLSVDWKNGFELLKLEAKLLLDAKEETF